MTLFQKIRTSFTAQLTLWVAGFVLVTSGVAFFFLMNYSEGVIDQATTEIVQQSLENTALRIDNRLKQAELVARLEKRPVKTSHAELEKMLEATGFLVSVRHTLPHAMLSFAKERPSDAANTHTFFQRVGERDFGLVLTSPDADLLSRFLRMRSVVLTWGIPCIVALLLVLALFIARHTSQLHRLANAAQRIADGNLETPIPDARFAHEAGRLQSSLQRMQAAQKAYMDEMQAKQLELSAQNSELQAALTEAQANEALQTAIVRDLSAEMNEPVEAICRCTERIRSERATLTRAEMARQQVQIMQSTETITKLLDELMHQVKL